MDRANITNQAVAEAVGMTHAGVSRLRSGDRLPSVNVMLRVDGWTGWAMKDQAQHHQLNTWGGAFERVLIERFGAVSVPATASS